MPDLKRSGFYFICQEEGKRGGGARCRKIICVLASRGPPGHGFWGRHVCPGAKGRELLHVGGVWYGPLLLPGGALHHEPLVVVALAVGVVGAVATGGVGVLLHEVALLQVLQLRGKKWEV